MPQPSDLKSRGGAPRVIIDTDPGQDDAIALMLALAAIEHIDVIAITTVSGNVRVELTTRNACLVRQWCARLDIPVYMGCERPLLRPPVTAYDVHGIEGLAGVPLDAPEHGHEALHATRFLAEFLGRAAPASITLCCLGPLTNLATVLLHSRAAATALAGAVIMGGSRHAGGNVTPHAEYNIFADPDAARVVFESGLPLTLVPLDVTTRVLTTPALLTQLEGLGNRCGPLAARILCSYQHYDMTQHQRSGAPLHDPCAVGWIVDPTIFEAAGVRLRVETIDEVTIGKTLIDDPHEQRMPANATLVQQADAERMRSLLVTMIGRLP